MLGYDVEAGANTLLQSAEERGVQVSPMKLQKLLYLSHGYYAALTGRPLINEEFEAWEYGPVAPTIYHELKQYGRRFIPRGHRVSRLDLQSFTIGFPVLPDDDSIANRVVEFIFDTYGAKTAVYLSDLTHKIDSPWDVVRRRNPDIRNAHIDNAIIAEYFQALIKKSSE
jgi:uncharacterized phage-associated protein